LPALSFAVYVILVFPENSFPGAFPDLTGLKQGRTCILLDHCYLIQKRHCLKRNKLATTTTNNIGIEIFYTYCNGALVYNSTYICKDYILRNWAISIVVG
jgi:hypothetical protein